MYITCNNHIHLLSLDTNLQTQLQLVRQCGSPSESCDVDLGILDGGMSPYGMSGSGMPAMIINDDFTMIEGAAICMYLADTYERFLPLAQYKAEYYRYSSRLYSCSNVCNWYYDLWKCFFLTDINSD